MFNSQKKPTRIVDLHPDLTEEEQRDAADNLRRYLGVVKMIYEHVATHEPEILTELRNRARLRKKLGNRLI
jgi:orotidine-5'-phosphate decarboxylase